MLRPNPVADQRRTQPSGVKLLLETLRTLSGSPELEIHSRVMDAIHGVCAENKMNKYRRSPPRRGISPDVAVRFLFNDCRNVKGFYQA